MNANSRHKKAQTKTAGGNKHRLTRPNALHPCTEHGRRRAQHRQGNTENPTDRGQLPISSSRFSDTDKLGQRRIEHGISVYLPDGKMHGQSGRRYQPTIKAGFGNGRLTV